MDTIDLKNKLTDAKESSDFISAAESVMDELREDESGLESVNVILKFMEENPSFDFGTPGPLVHFIESFYGRGYEAELVESLRRRPTTHTTWLLNRVINGTEQAVDRERYVSLLSEVNSHPESDLEARKLATHFLQRILA